MLIEQTNVIEGAAGMGGPLLHAGSPSAGINAVQTLTIDASGGNFQLRFDGETTDSIDWSSTNGTLTGNIKAALEALSTIDSGNISVTVGTMTSGVGTVVVTFKGNLAAQPLPLISVADNGLEGEGTLGVAETVAGELGTFARRAPKGAKLIDTDNGIDYINTGTQESPTWTKTGTQS